MHLFDAFHDGFVVLAVEGGTTRHQNVKDDSCRPNVTALVVVKPQHFGCDVVGGADEFVPTLTEQFLAHIFLPLVGEPEVDEFEFEGLLGGHQEVFRLDVPVRHLLGVHVLEALDDLDEDLAGTGFVELSVLLQSLEELPSLAETTFHSHLLFNQVDVLLVFEGFVQPDNHGVVQFSHDLYFVLKGLRVLN